MLDEIFPKKTSAEWLKVLTGADVLVTTYPACILQLSHGVRRHGLKVEVRHLTEAERLSLIQAGEKD